MFFLTDSFFRCSKSIFSFFSNTGIWTKLIKCQAFIYPQLIGSKRTYRRTNIRNIFGQERVIAFSSQVAIDKIVYQIGYLDLGHSGSFCDSYIVKDKTWVRQNKCYQTYGDEKYDLAHVPLAETNKSLRGFSWKWL